MSKTTYHILANVAAIVLAIGITFTAHASSAYYVSATGSDSNPGTSLAPFKTMQKAADTVPAGSIVDVMGSTNERVTVTRPSIDFECAAAPCQMQGFVISASNITVNGFSIDNIPNVSNGFGIYVTSTNCTLTNNYITHGNWGGISTSSASSGCLIKNNTLAYNSQSGLKILGSNHTVQGNDISHSIQNPSWTTNGVNLDADGILFFGSNNTFVGNYVHDISYNDPGNTSPHIDCHQTWANNDNANGIVFNGERCILDNIVSSTEEASTCFTTQENTGTILVENSLLDCTMGAFLKPTDGGSINFNHNQIIGQLQQSPSYSFGIWSNGAVGVTLTNNIVYDFSGDSVFVKNGGSVSGNNNLFYDSFKNVTFTGYSTAKDLANLDPKMDANYYLLPGSPAIGAASDGGNIGAFGVSGGAPATTATPTTLSTSQPSNTPTSIASPTPSMPTITQTAIPPTSTSTILPAASPTPIQPTSTPTLPTVAPTIAQLTSTSTTLPTKTSVPPTASLAPTLPAVTPTVIQPTSTNQPTSTSKPLPTNTPTAEPPTATLKPLPTNTPTSIPPTATSKPLPTNTSTSVPPTATAKSTPTSQPDSPITYDDKNSAFSYSSGWQTVTDAKAYGGSYKDTTQSGADVVLPFNGQSFSIVYRGGAYGQFDVFIDAQLVATLNEEQATDTDQQRWDYPGQLAQGSHRLKLEFKTTNTNVNCGTLDAVITR